MRHLSDEDLSILVAGEEPDATVSAHLAECPDCRSRRAILEKTIALVTSAERVPERGASYGHDVWARLSPNLPERRETAWPAFLTPGRLAFAAVLALVLVATFLAGRFWSVPQPAPLSTGVRERILVVALGEHLERSQAVLIELVNAPRDGDVDVTSEQARANDLIAANRLYRQTASRSGDPAVTPVLEELERLLLDVAHGPSHLSPEDLAALRQRIEEKGVLFKVRVIGSNLRERGERPAPLAQERKRT
ncbi:MAG TPA: hypothetical protein VFW15_02300 [Thermoanaerobaculia bacterium]|nr:hypothetical protein [Thermoanaerobaculia bacterium]